MSRREPRIVEVAVPSPLYRGFDYRLASGMPTPAAGCRVKVPFGRRQLVGIVLQVKAESDLPRAKLKPVAEILDSSPTLPEELFRLLCWTANYYHHPIGETFSTALPATLRRARPTPADADRGWRLTPGGREQLAAGGGRGKRQAEVLGRLAEHPAGLARDALPVPLSVIKSLQTRGWIAACRLDPEPVQPAPGAVRAQPPRLNEHQQQAVTRIQADAERFGCFLLEGVTGSGKTEVYLQLIAPLLARKRQVLVLVPEIGLTPQLVARFGERFGIPVCTLHSGLSEGQRLQAWRRTGAGEALLILGTRSALFTPLKRPGLLIVDEEHDASLKQQDGLRYSARDLAVWRARQWQIPVVLGSATPSLESLYNVQQGRYVHLRLPRRAGNARPPRLRLIDLRTQTLRALLSEALIRRMREHLAAGDQVLLFLNRRGYAPVLLCHACGWVADCQRCDARMTLHQQQRELRCHHCGSQRPVDPYCPACGSSELLGLGEGTERVEQTLRELFGDYPLRRIDRDTTRRKGALEDALAAAQRGDARILLGTQMLAKGHHFPGVTLVAVLDADRGLFSGDFRAAERLAQQIIQVAGRAGRADRPGEVLIQTHQPEHPLLVQLTTEGYPAFAAAALAERRQAGLPPYACMALLRAEAVNPAPPHEFLQEAAELAAQPGNVQVWGPVSAPMERRAGRYRAQLLLQATRRRDLQQLLDTWVARLDGLKSARRVRWSLDVDPLDTY